MSPAVQEALDAARLGAYLRSVDAGGHSSQDAPQASTALRVSRRRPPNPTEQARREAWGRKWGDLVAAEWRATKKRMGET